MKTYEKVIKRMASYRYHRWMEGGNDLRDDAATIVAFIYDKSGTEVIADVMIEFGLLLDKIEKQG